MRSPYTFYLLIITMMHRNLAGPLVARRCFQRQQHVSFVLVKHQMAEESRAAGVSKEIRSKASPNLAAEPSLSIWQRLGPFTKAINGYAYAQKTRPYLTQIASSIVVYALGDLGAQRLGEEKYDPLRTARNMAIGAVIAVPAYRWYHFDAIREA